MAKLRIYEAGKGDCIALRKGRETLMIFDTGQKSAYRRVKKTKDCRGFAKAIAEAVAAPDNRRRGKKTPIVIVSHVDEDHIGGLQSWVNDIFSRTYNWEEARTLARKEIGEVWCNIPPQDVALSWRASLPISYAKQNSSEGQRKLLESTTPFPQNLKDEEDWQKTIWTELCRNQDWADAPDEVLELLAERQNLIQALFNSDESDKENTLMDDGESGRFHKVGKWLKDMYGDYLNIYENDRFANISIDVPLNRERDGLTKNIPGIILRIHIHDFEHHVRLQMHCKVLLSMRTHLAFESTKVIPRELFQVLFPFLTYTPRSKPHPRQFSLDFNLDFHVPQADSDSSTYALLKKNVIQLIDCLEELDQGKNPLEVLAQIFEKLEGQQDFSLAQEERTFLAFLRLLFGIAPLDGIKERLSLFKVLELLEIPVRGTFVDGYLGAESSSNPSLNGLDYSFLSPSCKELNDLASRWAEYEGRLGVQLPTNFKVALFESLASPQAFRWQADRSVSNLSSISIWLKNVSNGNNVILTGDTLHSKIMEQLGVYVKKLGMPSNRRVHYQIPHHGGRRNTQIGVDPLPGDVLFGGGKISSVFATGGMKKAHNERKKQGPIKEVLDFFDKGSRKNAIATNESMNPNSGKFDIDL